MRSLEVVIAIVAAGLVGSCVNSGPDANEARPRDALAGSGNGSAADAPVLYQSLTDEDVAIAANMLQITLENSPDDANRAWRNPTSQNSGSVTPLSTYLSSTGYFCREYRETLSIRDNTETYLNRACRDDDGSWVWLR